MSSFFDLDRMNSNSNRRLHSCDIIISDSFSRFQTFCRNLELAKYFVAVITWWGHIHTQYNRNFWHEGLPFLRPFILRVITVMDHLAAHVTNRSRVRLCLHQRNTFNNFHMTLWKADSAVFSCCRVTTAINPLGPPDFSAQWVSAILFKENIVPSIVFVSLFCVFTPTQCVFLAVETNDDDSFGSSTLWSRPFSNECSPIAFVHIFCVRAASLWEWDRASERSSLCDRESCPLYFFRWQTLARQSARRRAAAP